MLRPPSIVRVFAIGVGLLLSASGSSTAQEGLVQLDPDRVSVMFMHGVVNLPNEMVPAPLDSVAFSVPEVEQLLGNHGVLRVEKIFKGFAAHDTLRQARTGEMVRVIDLSQIFLLHVGGERSLDALVGALEEEPSVVFAERLPILEPDAWDDPPANDAMLEDDLQWGLFNTGQREDSVRHADIDIKRAWQLQTGSEDILLGIIDTGVCYDHPDLSPTPGVPCFGSGCIVVGGDNIRDWNAIGCNPPAGWEPYDYCCPPLWADGHGTMVASAAVGITNNRAAGTWDGGAAGVAGGWQDEYGGGSTGSRILSYRAIGIDTPLYLPGVAVDYAVDDGADVVNMSFGGNWPSSYKTLWYPMINAFQQGVTMVASKGNVSFPGDDPTARQFPADVEQGVIAVGAMSFNNQRVTLTPIYEDEDPAQRFQSMYGQQLDVVAPGRLHWTAEAMYGPCGSWESVAPFGGTSCAAALTSGVACLLLAENPYLSNEEVEGIICASATDLVYEDAINNTYAYPGWDEETGWGRVDAFQALMRLRSPYDLQVRWAYGYDTEESTGVVHIVGEPGSRQKFEQHRLTKTVPLLSEQFTGTPYVWGLSRMSSGACSSLSYNDIWYGSPYEIVPELVMGYCKLVKGSTTGSECTLKTFYYELYEENPPGWDYKGWIPTDPGLAGWAYELSGIVLDPNASTCEAVPITQAPDGVPCLCPAADQDALALLLHLVDNFGQPLVGVPSTDVKIYVSSAGTGPPPAFPEACEAYSESSHVYRPEELIESDGNGDLLITLPPTGGADTAAVWTVRVSGMDIGGIVHPVRSVDMNADGYVNPVDFISFTEAYAAEEWVADLNGDGDVGPPDFVLFSSHFYHDCLPGALARGDQEDLEEEPSLVALLHNTPNPFAASTDIAFAVGDAGRRVSIRVYDLRGRFVRKLCDGEFEAGLHKVSWDGRSESGSDVASGVYFFKMESPGFRQQRKLVLLR